MGKQKDALSQPQERLNQGMYGGLKKPETYQKYNSMSRQPKIAQNVQDEIVMAELIVPLNRETKDSQTRLGMQSIGDLHRKELAEREKKQQMLIREHTNKTEKKNMHHILHSSTRESTQELPTCQ